MKAWELSRKYATAVFSLALEKWLTTLDVVHNELVNNPTLLERLQDASRSFNERREALDKLIRGEADENIRNFLYMMLRDGDIGALGDVLDELKRMARGGPQVQVARVTTAVPLTEGQKEQFQEKLRAKYGENLEVVFYEDKAILGGAVVRIGDKVIDGSVATRLESLSNTLGVKR